MFVIKGEHYFNDFTRERFERSFETLESIFEWFRETSDNFNGKYDNYFPRIVDIERGDIGRISVRDARKRGWVYWIYEIRTENGIVFSNGRTTNQQKFCASKIKVWISECARRMERIQNKPQFIEI